MNERKEAQELPDRKLRTILYFQFLHLTFSLLSFVFVEPQFDLYSVSVSHIVHQEVGEMFPTVFSPARTLYL